MKKIIYTLIVIALIYLILTNTLLFQNKGGLSAELNAKIEQLVLQGTQKIYLKELYPGTWNCVCLHEQYHTASNSLNRCFKKALSEKQTVISTEEFDVVPYDYTASESESGLIFVDLTAKRAEVFRPNFQMDGAVWPCHSQKTSYLSVRHTDQRNELFITLMKE